jgi:hypothetical protein
MVADLEDWLDGRSRADLLSLVGGLVSQVEGAGEWLALQQLRDDRDPGALRAEVEGVLSPRSGFYSYRQANEYAAGAEGVVTLLVEAADSPDLPLVSTIERALTLVTRTVLRADDPSGLLGDLVYRLLGAHARAVCGLGDALTVKVRLRIAEWLVKYRYGGKQDFFDPDIVAYASGLGDVGVARYRAAIADQDLGRYGRYPLERLAVLDRDPVAIVAAHGGEPANARVAEGIVEGLLEAGLDEEARRYARIGLALPAAEHTPKLADLLVDGALASGDALGALELRRARLVKHPESGAFGRLRETATALGVWDAERPAAEHILRTRVSWQFLSYLMNEGRDDEAWDFAIENADAAASASRWPELCARRAKRHPAETLPIYRRLITETLEVTDKRNYVQAANLLLAMREAAQSAGDDVGFEAFREEVVEANRRRPTCVAILRKTALV